MLRANQGDFGFFANMSICYWSVCCYGLWVNFQRLLSIFSVIDWRRDTCWTYWNHKSHYQEFQEKAERAAWIKILLSLTYKSNPKHTYSLKKMENKLWLMILSQTCWVVIEPNSFMNHLAPLNRLVSDYESHKSVNEEVLIDI